MIVEETNKTIEDTNSYFDSYIDELRDTQRRVVNDLQKTKQDAQTYIANVNSEIQSLNSDVQALIKENVVQLAKMARVSIAANKLDQQMNDYQMTKITDFVKVNPVIAIKFGDIPTVSESQQDHVIMDRSKSCLRNNEESESVVDESESPTELPDAEEHTTNATGEDDAESYTTCLDTMVIKQNRIVTSYNVNRIASDGKNILYASYVQDAPDIIAYCHFNDDGRQIDEHRNWNQTQIEDMIWWDAIQKFVCITENAVYTVEYVDRTLKIILAIHGAWSYARVATNKRDLFLWVNTTDMRFNGIEVYSTNFDRIRTIDFNCDRIGAYVDESVSFCVTYNSIALLCVRTRHKRHKLSANFCDFEMNRLNLFRLGICTDDAEIQSDGKDQFFVTTGKQKLYIFSSMNQMRWITLEDPSECIAVLNGRRLAVGNGSHEIQIIHY
ncbi:unnamed protein product [Adineta ricciae]|uniref:Uncharacterized protein n=1 Tax=Adineta ricciae TaxID=249248 RepID=A0A815M8W9_ADIRI|nr:unnamed protein product [Adineta ricciae]